MPCFVLVFPQTAVCDGYATRELPCIFLYMGHCRTNHGCLCGIATSPTLRYDDGHDPQECQDPMVACRGSGVARRAYEGKGLVALVGRCPYVIALRLGLWLIAWHVVARRFAFGLWRWLCAWLVRARLPSAARLLSLAVSGVWPFGKVAGGSRDTGGPSFFFPQPTKRLGHNLPNGWENTSPLVLTMNERWYIIRT